MMGSGSSGVSGQPATHHETVAPALETGLQVRLACAGQPRRAAEGELPSKINSRDSTGRASVDPATEEEKSIMEELLTMDEAAERLGTSPRFPRRLVTERRIRFVRVGRHVRIPASALAAYIEANTIEPMVRAR